LERSIERSIEPLIERTVEHSIERSIEHSIALADLYMLSETTPAAGGIGIAFMKKKRFCL